MARLDRDDRPIAFLFLGETLLIPHLYPILESLARGDPALKLDAWVATETHEVLIGRWIAETGLRSIRMRRAPGWHRTASPERGINPPLPAKIPLLARLTPRLLGARAVVCAEQTSLWIPALFGRFLRLPPFIQTLHGAGTINSGRGDRRRHAAALFMVPSESERVRYLDQGLDPQRIVTTGYVKAGFAHLAVSTPRFPQQRPIVLFNPHWQRHRSSWWEWGREVIAQIHASGRYNLIFAPHQRLVEGVPELRALCAELSTRDDTICDIDSFAAVDGSYPLAADIYLGDTSSQIVEFLQTPRPAVFLDPLHRSWRDDPSLAMWHCGEVVTAIAALLPALDRASENQSGLAAVKAAFVEEQMGISDGSGPDRAADAILAFLAARADR